MAINRYVDVNFDQPVSNYVPLPLEMLYKLGKDASKDYEDTMKDMESGKDPISKLNTRTVARIYDPSRGIMVDAPIDFEDQKKGVLDYMNKQKQQIVDDYIKDKDVNKYKQRAFALKGEITSAYSDLAGKAAIVEQINKENEQLSKSEAFGLDPAYATKRLQYNTEYLKNLKTGKVQAYAPPSVAKQIDQEEVLNKDASNWKDDDAGSTAYSTGDYIYEMSKKGITGTRVYDYVNRMWNSPNHSAKAYAQLQMEHEMNLRGLKEDSEVEYSDYKKDKDGNIILDKDKKPVIETKKGKFKDVFMEDKKHDYAQALADKIVHLNKDVKMSADAYGLHNYKRKLAEEDASTYENTTSVGNPEVTNLQTLLNDAGLADVIDTKGNIKSGGGQKYTAINSKGDKAEFDNSIDAHNFAGDTGIITQQRESSKTADDAVNTAFKKATEIGKALNLPTPKDGNWVKAVYNHFVNVSKQASSTSDLHPSTGESLTKHLLGDNSDISNTEIYPQGSKNKNDKATADVVAHLAGNSIITGIDYSTENGAGLKLNYTPKSSDGKSSGPDEAYVMISKNKNLEADTRPVRHITTTYINYSKNPMQYQEELKTNPGKYFQTDETSTGVLTEKATKEFGPNAKLISSSTEYRENKKTGKTYALIRGMVNLNGDPLVLTYNTETATWEKPKSLDAAQSEQTHYIETKGSLSQYNTKLQETLKTTSIQ